MVYIGIMEKKMETTGILWGYVGIYRDYMVYLLVRSEGRHYRV